MFSGLNTRIRTIVKFMRELNKISLLMIKVGFFLSSAMIVASIIVMFYGNEVFFMNPSLINISECGIESAMSVLTQTTIGALVIQYFFFKDK